MRYILCFLLPNELFREINLVRENFEKGVSTKIPPHISLTYPFWCEGKIEEVLGKVQFLVSTLDSFSVSISTVSSFVKKNGGRVIYLNLESETGLKKLHEKLISAIGNVAFDTSFFPKQKLPEEYKPHITLTMNGKVSDVEEVQKKLAKIKGEEFLVQKIYLLSNKSPKKSWEIEKSFKFKV